MERDEIVQMDTTLKHCQTMTGSLQAWNKRFRICWSPRPGLSAFWQSAPSAARTLRWASARPSRKFPMMTGCVSIDGIDIISLYVIPIKCVYFFNIEAIVGERSFFTSFWTMTNRSPDYFMMSLTGRLKRWLAQQINKILARQQNDLFVETVNPIAAVTLEKDFPKSKNTKIAKFSCFFALWNLPSTFTTWKKGRFWKQIRSWMERYRRRTYNGYLRLFTSQNHVECCW